MSSLQTTDYNLIALQYKEAKEQAWRDYVETYSLLKLIGPTTGLKVIDVACGEGYFTRKLHAAGAAQTIGSDISEKMIELARMQERAQPAGIAYEVADARVAGPQQDFDLAASAWLLVYAHHRAELLQMSQSLARRLRPGGRFVTLTTNPNVYHFSKRPYQNYGFDIAVKEHAYEGAPIDWYIYLEDSTLHIQNYYLPLEAYENAFREAGFQEIRFHGLSVSPEGIMAKGEAHWEDMLNCPPAVLMECVRS